MGCKSKGNAPQANSLQWINSYIVGCKCWYAWLGLIRPWRINSYIVGCKLQHKWDILCCRAGINSYIVGCKLEFIRYKKISLTELIVT